MGLNINKTLNNILEKSFNKTFNKNIKLLFCCCFCYGIVFEVSAVSAEEACQKWKDDFKNNSNLVVGEIVINAADVFDLKNPKESKAIHRIANKIHVSTKPKVIRRQLLFKSGEPFQLRKLSESQRLIRSNGYIQEVEITPYELERVNIRVDTTDNWTLAPGVSFSQSGGNSKSGIEIQEQNLLGLGKGLVLGFKSHEERDETLLAYTDPQFLGTRQQLYASVKNNSDGKGHVVYLTLPFFELDSRKAWGLVSSSISEENSIYDRGDVSNKVYVNLSSPFFGAGLMA